ncbi:MAG TPA: DUF1569 domain-containing protein [Gemmatimonadaceae bacterium]|nr:DUF1569 domain-containing protein [Gemmatimonadaceae bacterium]
MKNLYQPAVVSELHQRFATLRPDSQPLWGKMTAAQMAAHCARTMEYALGEFSLKRHPIGRLLGRRVLRSMIVDGKPMERHAPTHKTVKVTDARELEPERARLDRAIDRFAGGTAACTKEPHFFFGAMTPEEWATFSYVHLDHHLRQFGV